MRFLLDSVSAVFAVLPYYSAGLREYFQKFTTLTVSSNPSLSHAVNASIIRTVTDRKPSLEIFKESESFWQ